MRGVVCAATFALAFPPAAGALEGTLLVNPATSLTATLDAIDVVSVPVAVSGSAAVSIQVADDPVLGTVATGAQVTAGRLFLGDFGFALGFGDYVQLQVATSGIEAQPAGPAAPASPTGPGTSSVLLDGFGLRLETGTASASGVALGEPVSELSDFGAQPGELRAAVGSPAVIATSGLAQGPVQVTVTVPIDALLLAIDARLDAPLALEGQLVLSGTIAAVQGVPALEGWGVAWAALLLLMSAAFGLERVRLARARGRSRAGPG
jgi:hypothetical protein